MIFLRRIAHIIFRVAGVKAQKLNSLILVLIPNHTRTASSAWKYSCVNCCCGWRNGIVLLRGSMVFFYIMEKSAFFLPLTPQSVPQLGSAELFVSTPVTGFSIDRPPTETRSATSQASHRWKAQLWTELSFLEGGGCAVVGCCLGFFFTTDKPCKIRKTALTNNYRSRPSWNLLSLQSQIPHRWVTLCATSVVPSSTDPLH